MLTVVFNNLLFYSTCICTVILMISVFPSKTRNCSRTSNDHNDNNNSMLMTMEKKNNDNNRVLHDRLCNIIIDDKRGFLHARPRTRLYIINHFTASHLTRNTMSTHDERSAYVGDLLVSLAVLHQIVFDHFVAVSSVRFVWYFLRMATRKTT